MQACYAGACPLIDFWRRCDLRRCGHRWHRRRHRCARSRSGRQHQSSRGRPLATAWPGQLRLQWRACTYGGTVDGRSNEEPSANHVCVHVHCRDFHGTSTAIVIWSTCRMLAQVAVVHRWGPAPCLSCHNACRPDRRARNARGLHKAAGDGALATHLCAVLGAMAIALMPNCAWPEGRPTVLRLAARGYAFNAASSKFANGGCDNGLGPNFCLCLQPQNSSPRKPRKIPLETSWHACAVQHRECGASLSFFDTECADVRISC